MKLLMPHLLMIRSCLSTISIVLISSASLLGIVLLLHFSEGIPISFLTRDPSSEFSAPIYLGFISQVGILLWSAAATVCLYNWKIASRRSKSAKIRNFFLVSGLLTLFLCLDDAFLLHDVVFPYIGIPEKVIYACYVGIVLVYLISSYSLISKTEFVLLEIALLFFGISLSSDAFLPTLFTRDVSILIEDGAKLVGIVSWLAYFYKAALWASHQDDVLRMPNASLTTDRFARS